MNITKYRKFSLYREYLPLFLAFLLVMSAPSIAATQHEKVEQGVKAYLMASLSTNNDDTNIDINVVKIDDRINIPQCPSEFQYHASEEALKQSYISVRVSCNTNDWYVFTSAQVNRTKEIVVTAGAVSPGTVLTLENLTLAEVDIRRLRHTAFTNLDTLIGARMKRRVVDGQAIQSNMLCFVCKGDRITIKASVGTMAVKTAGIAEQDGVIGDTIRVTNSSTQNTVVAEVASAKEVVVHL